LWYFAPLIQPNPHRYFRIAIAVCFFILACIGIFLGVYGKTDSFLIINRNYNPLLDQVFQYVTLLGDGMIYVPIVIYCLFFNRYYLVAVISGIIICTMITQMMKLYVFPEDLRPFSLEAKHIIIHKISGVPLNRLHSFPSGHTSTAFTMALLLCEIIKRKYWCVLLPLIAVFVGYSRVYLAQHFVTDVTAGMIIGMISAYLSLLLYDRFKPMRKKKNQLV
jgi:membrane-associated phospholipid phosphatase